MFVLNWMMLTTQIQPASSPDGGSAPREDHSISECQWRPCQLDVAYRQIPCEDLFSSSDISTTELSWTMTSLNQPWTDFNWETDCLLLSSF